MPTYEFCCEKCEKHFEKRMKMDDKTEVVCPDCGARAKKQVVASGFILKGFRWAAKEGY